MREQHPTERFTLSLDARQVAGVVAGALVVLAAAFALGAAFGRQLAVAPPPPQVAADLARLDTPDTAAQAANTPRYTYAELLAKPDPTPVVTAKAEPKPVEKPVEKPVVAEPAPLPATPEVVITPPPAPAPVEPQKPATAPAPAPIAAPKPIAPKLPAPPANALTPGRFTVQLGASPDAAEAQKVVQKLQDAGFSPYVVLVDVPGKGRFHRIRVGSFATRDEADKQLRGTKAAGFAGVIMGTK